MIEIVKVVYGMLVYNLLMLPYGLI